MQIAAKTKKRFARVKYPPRQKAVHIQDRRRFDPGLQSSFSLNKSATRPVQIAKRPHHIVYIYYSTENQLKRKNILPPRRPVY